MERRPSEAPTEQMQLTSQCVTFLNGLERTQVTSLLLDNFSLLVSAMEKSGCRWVTRRGRRAVYLCLLNRPRALCVELINLGKRNVTMRQKICTPPGHILKCCFL